MATLLVESRYDTPLSDADRADITNRLLPCLAQYGGRWRQTYVSTDRARPASNG